MQIQNLCDSKDTIEWIRRQSTECEKLFPNNNLIRDQYPGYIDDSYNSKKTNNQIKNEKMTWRDIFLKKIRMPNKNMKRSSTSLIIREVEIKITKRYYFTLIIKQTKPPRN